MCMPLYARIRLLECNLIMKPLKLLKLTKLALPLLLAAQLSLPVLAGESWKPFTAFELGLMFLDPQGLTEDADVSLDKLFGVSGDLLSDVPDGALSAAKPLGESILGLREQVMGVAKGQSQAITPLLKPYQVLDKAGLNYEQIDLPNKPDLRSLVETSNEVLKKIYRISGTVKLSEQLLPTLKNDMGKLKGSDALQKASLGIVTVSLANLNVGAGQSAAQLRTQLESLQQRVERKLKETQSAVTSNPLNAMSMGEDIQVLTSLTGTLTRASGALAEAGTKLPGVLGSLQGLVTALKG